MNALMQSSDISYDTVSEYTFYRYIYRDQTNSGTYYNRCQNRKSKIGEISRVTHYSKLKSFHAVKTCSDT